MYALPIMAAGAIALLTVAIVLFLIGHFGRSFVKRKMRIGDDEEERDEQQ